MSKKFFSILMVIIVTFMFLTGCRQSSQTSDSRSSSVTDSTKDDKKDSKTELETSLEMSDVPNMTAPGVLPIVVDPVKITIAMVPNVTVTDYDDNEFTKWVEEKTGIDIVFEFLPNDRPAQKIELMVASNQKLSDIVCTPSLSNLSKNEFYENGIILALDEYMDKYCYYWNIMMEKWVTTEKEVEAMEALTRSFDGTRIIYPTIYTDPSNMYNPTYTIYINKHWLDKIGKDMPTTTDELFDVLVAFRDNDMNDNGENDEIPLITRMVAALINSFIYYHPDNPLFNMENNIISSPVVTNEYREALRYLNKLVKEGLLSPLSFTSDNQQLKSMLYLDGTDIKPYIGAFSGHPTTLFNTNSVVRNYYKAAIPIKGPEGIWYPIYTPQAQEYRTFITKYCETPEIAIRLLDFMSEEETMLRSRWGVPGQDFVYADPSEECRYEFLGLSSIYRIINNPYGSSNNLIWKNDYITCLPHRLYGSIALAKYDNEAQEEYALHSREVLLQKWGKEPKQVVGKIIYTKEEEDNISEINSTLKTYVKECQTRFIMGEMSIEDDWDEYINTLKNIGLDLVIETTQIAWNRMIGKK